MTAGTEDRGDEPSAPERPTTPSPDAARLREAGGEDVVEPIEETEEYAAAAEDDTPLPALAPSPPPASELSGRPASAEPAKGPEQDR